MTQSADLAAGNRDLAHVEELDVGYWAAVELVQNQIRVGTLHLIAIQSANDRHVAGNGALVPGQGDFVSVLFRVVLNPVMNRRTADEQQLILVEVEEDRVTDNVPIVAAADELLGFVDRIILETVDAGSRE